MAQKFYPAVLERDEKGLYAVWFPDFPGCVAAAAEEQQAIAKAHDALAGAVQAAAEAEGKLPEPSAFETIETPDDIDLVALIAIAVTPPDPSERVNVYLPKSLIERMDQRAGAFGMSRSSYVGLVVSRALSQDQAWLPHWTAVSGQGRGRK